MPTNIECSLGDKLIQSVELHTGEWEFIDTYDDVRNNGGSLLIYRDKEETSIHQITEPRHMRIRETKGEENFVKIRDVTRKIGTLSLSNPHVTILTARREDASMMLLNISHS